MTRAIGTGAGAAGRERKRAEQGDSERNPYLRALRGMWPVFAAAAGFSALINLLMLTGPLYMLQVYDRVLSSGSLATLQGIFLIVVVLFAFMGLYEFLRARLLGRAAVRLETELGPAALRAWIGEGAAAQGAPLRDLATLRSFLSGPAVGAFCDLPWIPLYLGVLFLIHPWLGWLTVAGAGVVALAAWANRRLTRGAQERAALRDGMARRFAEQGLRNAGLIRAMGMERRIAAHWWQLQAHAIATGQRGSDISEATGAFSKTFRLFLQSAMLTMGAFLVLRHEMSAGMIIASSILSGRALAPVDMVIAQWRAIGQAAAAHRALRAFFAGRGEPARIALPAPSGAVSVRGLTCFAPGAAPGTERARMLSGVSFDLVAGEGLGVIGNSAAGKSTLARALVGSLASDLGEIRFDGATRAQWDPEVLGRSVGYLPQVVELLPGTIRDNIARFDPEAPDEAVIAAARLAGLHEMILALPEGYATLVGTPDQPLSGGQVQRLGLCRAIFGMPKIVVLDEPNSNLDAAGEAALAGAVRALRAAGSTVVLMTHRTSALAEMSRILMLNAGQIVRLGERDEVLRGLMLQPVAGTNEGNAAPRPAPAAESHPAPGRPAGGEGAAAATIARVAADMGVGLVRAARPKAGMEAVSGGGAGAPSRETAPEAEPLRGAGGRREGLA